jgi:hypothetical protein
MMVMRSQSVLTKSFLIALPLFAIASPVSAQDVVFVSGTGERSPVASFEEEPLRDVGAETKMMDMADRMSDPAMQAGVAAAVEHMTSTMMRLPVGQFAAAIEDARPGTVNKRIRRDTTIADLAGRDADNLPEKLGDGSRQMMGMMSGFARAFAVMMPELEKMGREMEDSFRNAKAEAKRNQD